MTALALIRTQFLCSKGIRRVRSIMTLDALFVRNGLMYVCIQYPSPVGTVGVVAGRAFRSRDRIIIVPGQERRLVRLMALETEGFFISL